MTFPLVIETALPQEPVAHDTFIDDLSAVPAGPQSSAAGLVGGGHVPPPAQRPA